MDKWSLESIRQTIGEYVSSTSGSPVDIDTPLQEVILDSMAMVLYVSHLEKTFGIEMPPEDLIAGMLGTIGSAAEYIQRRLAGGEG
jgi:acyl carrier protein